MRQSFIGSIGSTMHAWDVKGRSLEMFSAQGWAFCVALTWSCQPAEIDQRPLERLLRSAHQMGLFLIKASHDEIFIGNNGLSNLMHEDGRPSLKYYVSFIFLHSLALSFEYHHRGLLRLDLGCNECLNCNDWLNCNVLNKFTIQNLIVLQ